MSQLPVWEDPKYRRVKRIRGIDKGQMRCECPYGESGAMWEAYRTGVSKFQPMPPGHLMFKNCDYYGMVLVDVGGNEI